MARGTQIKAERRRRKSSTTGRRTKLTLDESKLDTDQYEYRWIKNTPDRLAELTVDDDWNLVEDRDKVIKDDDTGMGSNVSIHAGKGEDGSPERLVLAQKRKEYQNDDRAVKAKHIDDLEAGLAQGDVPNAKAASGKLFYQPKSGGIQMER